MSSISPKRAIFEQFAMVAQALANAHRVELIELVAQGERSVDELARLSGLTVTNASQHLHLLRRAGLVVARRAGKHVLYRVAERDVVDLLMAVRRTAERGIAEIDKIVESYFHARDKLEPVSHDELANRLRDGVVTLIDVRPGEEFVAGHIPGAVNIPLDELPRRLSELPADRTIIAYCRGPYCVFAFEAVAALRAQGYDARRLADGYPQWWAAQRPVTSAVA
ncbi:MAG: metalloregulator ArsR/SmtB family transcription factor [Acidibrevibacterium sp.]|jgi:ArsR family transcriptional regulator|uniref:ArsR/SmtB family transcription factor n=1 Tax=Acidibrevibacterium fodinaquatile TaxID=1969806 RepID=UPI0023A8A181|nr:metalloregulator ArsR/SmtB family transcription factor [Acidibrevibacterium fodinaquatile]MCA7118361.1 metalloregulator ArsR/SmtB family transcription factor [Acidibrevibacterium fodinaquatile]